MGQVPIIHPQGRVAPAPQALTLPAAATMPTMLATSSLRLTLPMPAPHCLYQDAPSDVSLQLHEGDHAANGPEQPQPKWRHYSEPKIPQHQLGEDIEDYLLRF